MVQVQVLNGVPSMNIYGRYSMTDGFNFKDINRKGIYGYWDHMDYIIKSAASRGIYIGMVCIWGTPVEQGLMNEKEAVAYGKFLAARYKDEPKLIWMIGGDIRGDSKTAAWDALANSILSIRVDVPRRLLGLMTANGWISICSKADTVVTGSVTVMVTILSKRIRKKITGVLWKPVRQSLR